MKKFNWKKQVPPNLSKLLHQKVESSHWITNFWIIDDWLYLTDAKFDVEPKLLATIPMGDINVNISKKGVLNEDFLKHPHPLNSSFLEASHTAITTINYFDDYLYNVVKVNEDYYLSLIKPNRLSSYILKFDHQWEEVQQVETWNDYVLIGCFLDGLLFQTLTSKQTYFYVNNEFKEFNLTNLNQVVEVENAYLLSTLDFKLYVYWKETAASNLIKQFDSEFFISSFDASSFLISVEQERETYYVNGDAYDHFNLLTSQYFYRLASWKKQLLIGKPLYLDNHLFDYDQPLIFIK